MEKGGDRMNIELLRQFLDFYAVYLVTQLGRSVLCSFFLLPLLLALRITVFKSSPFLFFQAEDGIRDTNS